MNDFIVELRNCITVDVGKSTAIAYWTGDAFPKTFEIVYKKSVKKNIESYLELMTEQFDNILRKCSAYGFEYVQIEGTELWADSERSQVSAKRGDLFTVAYLVGALTIRSFDHSDDVRIREARKWKGQLSKEGTSARVKRINGMTYSSEHITDAVAMGFANVEDIWLLKRSVK